MHLKRVGTAPQPRGWVTHSCLCAHVQLCVCMQHACAALSVCSCVCPCVVWTHTHTSRCVSAVSPREQGLLQKQGHGPGLPPPLSGRKPQADAHVTRSHADTRRGHRSQNASVSHLRLVQAAKGPMSHTCLVRGSSVAKAKLESCLGQKVARRAVFCRPGEGASSRPWRGDLLGVVIPHPRSSFTGTGRP